MLEPAIIYTTLSIMAIGIPPRYTGELNLDELNLSPEQFLVVASEAVMQLGWDIGWLNASGMVAYAPISISSWSEEVKIIREGGSVKIKSECLGKQIVDFGKNRRNIVRFIDVFTAIKEASQAEELEQKYLALQQRFPEVLNGQPLTEKEKFDNIFSFFTPTEGYFITPVLINFNIIVFMLMALCGAGIFEHNADSLIWWGANLRPFTMAGEWWRLLTNYFLHIGLLQLIMNMYALLYIGALMEPYLGRTRFLSAYLLSGLAGSITSLYWHDAAVSVGASSAIFGLYGVFLIMMTTDLIEKSARKALFSSIVFFVVFNLLMGLRGGVDNASHIGGLMGGLVIGCACFPGLFKPYVLNFKLGNNWFSKGQSS